MSLQFNENDARKGDKVSSIIRDTGKYVGVITRAEKLLSKNSVQGVGLSFKADDGATASYLDVYTVKADGTTLWGHNIIQALLCCAGVKTVDEGTIEFDKWDKDVKEMVKAKAPGYPALMGKRIGLVLQKELQDHYQDSSQTVERINIVGVFRAADNFTASEILDKALKAEKLEARMKALQPVKDSRKTSGLLEKMKAVPLAMQPGYVEPGFDDSISF